MRTTSGSLFSAAIGLGLSASIGCATEAAPRLPPVDQLADGISIIEADPARGVLGAYRAGDHAVYFETRTGYLKPAIYREEFPDEPANEIDMRFLDENGLTFSVQRGGDELIDATWGESINAMFQTPVAETDRALDFALAQAAARAFPEIAEPALSDHSFHLAAHGARPLPSEDPRLLEPTAIAETVPRAPATYATISGTGCWDLAGGMSHSSVAIFGTHGSVQLWAKPCGTSTWYFQLNMCNHGSCTGSHQCFTYGWNLSNPSINYESSTSTDTVSGGCATSYYWDGGWGYHNSNDDTAYELWQTKEGRHSTSRGDSNSFSWQAPNKLYRCNGDNGRWTAPSACP